MKYIVKRAIPQLKVGELVHHVLTNMGMHIFAKIVDSQTSEIYCSKEVWILLLSEGWVEEIKPREFWVNVYNNYNAYVHPTKESAENISKSSCETIRVREVIEE